MRFLSGVAFAAAVFACSSASTPGTTPANPEGGTSSSSGGSSGGGSSSGGSSGTPAPSDDVDTTTVTLPGGKYVLSVPRDHDAAKKYPLWIFLHGHPGSAEVGAGFQLHGITKREAILAYPGAAAGTWDHGAVYTDNADSALILALIDDIAAKYSLDKGRVLVSGWSGGGFMASMMACRYSAKFRAIGIHAGGAPYDGSDPNVTPDCAGASLATFVSHGEADGTVSADSGRYAAQYWSEHNGCSASKTASTPAPCETYAGCPAGKPVKACFIPGLGHPVWDQALTAEWAWFKSLP